MDGGTDISPRIDPRDLARSVPIRILLRNLGVRVRGSKRADCPFTERLWRCHRCSAGGDVFSLVQAVRKSDFHEALKFVAELAGVRLDNRRGLDFHRELAARQAGRERVEAAAVKLEALERELRLDVRQAVHFAEKSRARAAARLAELGTGASGAEVEELWAELKSAAAWLERDLPAYTLLSFGSVAERCAFVLKPSLREGMVRDVRWRGYVTGDDGKQFPVVLA